MIGHLMEVADAVEAIATIQVIHAWLSLLPIKQDLIAVKGADELLCSLAER
ncbi:hypothetical protein HanRHA438_Chr13g0606961 [Helianthus annuus]|nr:hypothetical protein HanHA300_Chr13g0489131 [Helianthus annuus]KAJ0481968.1 hypothetical protein HanIR_Chr13g0648681 [Helianthus annuus]KAJ0498322.1 hypothetical protein HanHA89_Chr13g0521271 [Helianthus annuus]KAJ0664332.1 hypothetical protein HanLR1_Chr13g0491201 [Helianthus annuus]KAJ0671795.1 hypothetical protein HanOQP8_Chr13g0489691 [Helianthus annuus]